MNDNITLRKNKTIYYEIIRIIAILFVIYNHTNNRGYTYFTNLNSSSLYYYLCLAISIICGISVPLFLMVSGALLLNRTSSYKEIYFKRIPKYIAILFIFSLIYYMKQIRWEISAFDVQYFFIQTITKGIIIPHWFLYSYICFLLILPLLQKMVINLEPHHYIYLLCVVTFMQGVLPMITYIASKGTYSIHNSFSIAFLANNIFFYPLMGYGVAHKLKSINRRQILIASLVFVISIALSEYMSVLKIRITGEIAEGQVSTFFGLFRHFQVVYIFIIMRYWFSSLSDSTVMAKIILSAGSCTFGIFLFEQYIRELFYPLVYDKLCTYIPNYLAVWIYIFFVFCIGWVITLLLKKIKWIKSLF